MPTTLWLMRKDRHERYKFTTPIRSTATPVSGNRSPHPLISSLAAETAVLDTRGRLYRLLVDTRCSHLTLTSHNWLALPIPNMCTKYSDALGIFYVSSSLSTLPKAATPVGSAPATAAADDDDDEDDDDMEPAFTWVIWIRWHSVVSAFTMCLATNNTWSVGVMYAFEVHA